MDSAHREWVDKALTKRGLSQKKLADLLGVAQVTVSKWLNGKTRVSSDAHLLTLRILADDHCPANEFAQWVRMQRSRMGVSQKALADTADLSVPGLAQIEAGKVSPRSSTREALLRALGVPANSTPPSVGTKPTSPRLNPQSEIAAHPEEEKAAIAKGPIKDQVREQVVQILQANPQGLQNGDLLASISERVPGINKSTFSVYLSTMINEENPRIYRPSYGVVKLLDAEDERADDDAKRVIAQEDLSEDDFYRPFAQWLKNDLGECNEAIPFGGNYIRTKWGTPDVIGVSRPRRRDIIQFAPEITTAEIKLDPTQVITAFGQAVAYRLFSNRVYLVLPVTIGEDDKSRIEALCLLFGLGLVLFRLDKDNPDFQVRVRAQRHDTDYLYTNNFLDAVDKSDPDALRKLL